ncbi:MAG: hypothetical protein WC408_02255 [Candidatus Micrarchaeia archaeon]
MDLEKFLELADANRRAAKAHVGELPLSQVYAMHAHRTSSLKFSVVAGKVCVAVDGFAAALASY